MGFRLIANRSSKPAKGPQLWHVAHPNVSFGAFPTPQVAPMLMFLGRIPADVSQLTQFVIQELSVVAWVIALGIIRYGWPNADVPSAMPYTVDVVSDDFLASTADLVKVLARLADPGRRFSPQHRHDYQLAQTALSNLLLERVSVDQLPVPPAVSPQVATVAPQRTVAQNASAFGRRAPTQARRKGSGRRLRQYCRCGQCRWCLDNARWDQIYNDKFADPAYYGHIVMRHNSTLAEAR